MIDFEGLEAAVAASKEILKILQSEYPDMRAYLVLSYRGQQTDLTSNPINILEDCDQMVADDDIKRDALRLQVQIQKMESAGASERSVQPVIKALAARGRELRFLPEVMIEIRLHELRYVLVWALQGHPLIDQQLTPQGKSSIRIVIGTLRRLSRTVIIPAS